MKILKIQKTKSDLIILELHKKWRIIELVGTPVSEGGSRHKKE